MDEEVKVSEGYLSVPERRRRGREQSKEPVRFSTRTPKWRDSFNVEDKWSLTEKNKLLEALKRHDTDNISKIAKLVGTKSEKEVEEKIQSLRGADSFRGQIERVDGTGSEKAPIEAWIDLVQEMTKFEHGDYSQFVPKVLGLITRNEKFADSGVPQLQWRNIYQFLADITEDRAEVQKLTDMESLVVLDLMHSLGNTLLKSDTTEQRRVMDYKYNLLNFKSDNPKKWEREVNIHRIAQALSNDLWDLEDIQDESADTPDTSAVSSAQSNIQLIQENEQSAEGRNMTEISSSMNSVVHHAVPGTSNSPSQYVENTVTSDHEYSSKPSNEQQGRCSDNGADESGATKTNKRKRDPSSGVRLVYSNRYGKKFVRPKYFTLNPLCVPTQPLAFRPN